MEILWFCEQCDTTNDYNETKVCNVCGAEIDQKSEEKCMYEVALQLHKKAMTSEEFFAARDEYSKVLHYKEARQKYEECQAKAAEAILKEDVYAEAKQLAERARDYALSGKWIEADCEYGAAEQQFKEINGFLDANSCAKECQRQKELCHSKQIYADAKAVLSKANSMEDYRYAAELFSKITKFADAQENYEVCLEFIHQLKAKQQYEDVLQRKRQADEETDLDKKIVLFQNIVSLEHTAMSDQVKNTILECKVSFEQCLKQRKEIQTQQALKKVMERCHSAEQIEDHVVRAQTLEKIMKDYQAYENEPTFAEVWSLCRERLTEALNSMTYEAALVRMNSAKTAADYKAIRDEFASISDFKDSNQKMDECSEKADVLEKQAVYEAAMEQYRRGRQINIFNWRKYV